MHGRSGKRFHGQNYRVKIHCGRTFFEGGRKSRPLFREDVECPRPMLSSTSVVLRRHRRCQESLTGT
jgi:hypothetical protein